MPIIDALALAVLSSLLLYSIKRIDEMDARIDALEKHLVKIEMMVDRRKAEERHHTSLDDGWYSDNSGIKL